VLNYFSKSLKIKVIDKHIISVTTVIYNP